MAMGDEQVAKGEGRNALQRRRFLTGLAALGAGAVLPGCQSAGQGRAPSRIDVHHHLAPPGFIKEIVARKTGQRPLMEWTPAKSVAEMDKAGIATAITSISEPGVWYGDSAAARTLARECNEFGARMARDYPGRFGQFASLPIPDVEGSLREIEHALDVLKADGICLLTSYGGKYLGDPAFAPVMDELNRRKAVVYTHPVRADCCRNLIPGVGENVIELGTDTARTITSLLVSGTTARCPDIRFIFSHAGGTLPALAGRIVQLHAANKNFAKHAPEGPIAALGKLYYDTANAANPWALAPLLKLVPISQVVFGSDYPLRSAEASVKAMTELGFSAADLRAIDRENALALLPRLGKS
jgi:predicted TIM-barrel fold metal-dependent hydrolase